jgi:hypothetical protein
MNFGMNASTHQPLWPEAWGCGMDAQSLAALQAGARLGVC